MPKIRLKGSRIMPLVSERKSAGMPQHMRMGLETKLCLDTRALDHAGETGRTEARRAPN